MGAAARVHGAIQLAFSFSFLRPSFLLRVNCERARRWHLHVAGMPWHLVSTYHWVGAGFAGRGLCRGCRCQGPRRHPAPHSFFIFVPVFSSTCKLQKMTLKKLKENLSSQCEPSRRGPFLGAFCVMKKLNKPKVVRFWAFFRHIGLF